jgi:hypothetical protein
MSTFWRSVIWMPTEERSTSPKGYAEQWMQRSNPDPSGHSCQRRQQRAILNFTPGPQGWTSPPGVNLATRGELCPLGEMFTPSFTPRDEHSPLFRRTEGQNRISPPGDNFTPGDKIHPWRWSLPLGAKFRMGLSFVKRIGDTIRVTRFGKISPFRQMFTLSNLKNLT